LNDCGLVVCPDGKLGHPNNSGGFGLMPEIYHCLLAKQEFAMLFDGVKCKAVKEQQWITDSVRISLGRSTRKEALLGKPAVKI
jgi:hypothetical protein